MATPNTVSTTILHRIQNSDPSLTKLKLEHDPSDNYADFRAFVLALQQNCSIQHVFLHGYYLGKLSDEDYTWLLHALASIQSLQELEFCSARVPLAWVCRALEQHRTIQKLHIDMGKLCEWSDCSALAEHPSLKTFCLREFHFTDPQGTETHAPNGLDSLLDALSTCPALERVVINGYIHSNRGSEGVPASANGLGALAHSPSLKRLLLRSMNLKNADLRVFASNVRQRSSPLQGLDLDRNPLQDLTALNQVVSEHQSLKTLSLRINRLTPARCVGLVLAISRNRRSSLEKLILSNNNLGDGAADSLALLLKATSLKHIELNHTHLTDRSLVPMAQALETNTFLETLTLFGNRIGDESYVAFASALTRNSTLKLIDLESDHLWLTVVGAKALLEMLLNNFVIEHICTPVTVLSYKWTGELLSMGTEIRIFLRLNRAGRKRLILGPSSRQDWLEMIAKVGDDLDAVHYLVRANPFLCDSIIK